MKHKYTFFLLFGLLIFVSACSSGDFKYKKSIYDTFEAGKNIPIISADKLAEIVLGEDTLNYQFVDIRNPHEFNISHVTNAINIPFDVLQGDNCKIFCEKDKTFLIYGNNTSEARIAASFLNQMGINNIMAVGGGHSFIQENIINQFGIYSDLYDDEIALYDYKKVISETPKGNAGSSPTGDLSFVPVARKSEVAAGGCE